MGEREFARVVKRRRDTLGLSQARLGELVGRSASTIRNWERGRSLPSTLSDVRTLAAVLGVDEHRLLADAGFEVPGEGAGPVGTETRPTVEQVYASLSTTELDRLQFEEAGPEESSSELEEGPPVDTPTEVSEPGVAEPDVSAPEVAEPDVAPPEVPEPEVPEPEVSSPEVAGPERPDADDGFDPGDERDWPAWVSPPDDDDLEAPAEETDEGVGVDDRVDEDTPETPADAPSPAPAAFETEGAPDPDTDSDTDAGTDPLVGDAGVPPSLDWARPKGESGFRRRVERAAPPTVLERATPGEPSYLEDPEERQRYRMRALLTAALVVAMVIVLMWSFGRAADIVGSLWDDITGMLSV